MKIKIIIIIALLALLTTSGFGCKKGDVAAIKALSEPVVLNYWRVFDGQDKFDEIIRSYQSFHPNITINYRKLRYEEYEQALLEAWAADEGPDIFSIHNTWVKKYENKTLPLPDKIKLPYVVSYNRQGKVEKAVFKETYTLTPQDIRRDYVDVVFGDSVTSEGKILGLPLSVDTLALFYNRDLLDQAKVFNPPVTWLDVKEASQKITLQDSQGNIVRSGIALGGADNINNAFDILSLLMMQNGTQMVDETGTIATFANPSPHVQDDNYQPGHDAVRFYTDFARASKEVYTWNENLPEAAEAFVRGNLAMMLGYAYQIPYIKSQGLRLNWGVTQAPHINANGTDALGYQINYANYWLETVAKKTVHPDEAWDFVIYLTRAETAEKYLNLTSKPAALRSLLEKQFSEPTLSVFANQVLTAKSWYKGNNFSLVQQAFREIIREVVTSKKTITEAISYAVQVVNRTLR